jgi:hypothetical protein
MADIDLEAIQAELRATLARRRADLLARLAAAPASDTPVAVYAVGGYSVFERGQIRYVSPAEQAARYQTAVRHLLVWYVAQYAAMRQEIR